MTPKEHESDDGWEARVFAESAPAPAFEDESGHYRQITLTVQAPVLALPGEVENAAALSAARVPEPDAHHHDAWTADRLMRSSLPPSSKPSISSYPAALWPAAEEREGQALEGDAFELVSRSGSSTLPVLDLVSEMAERFALGDFSGALRASELLLGQRPGHELAQHYARESYHKLETLFTSRLASHGRILLVAVAESEVRWLGLDPHVGVLLSRIDGVSDYETVIAASGMPRLSALKALCELLDARVVRLV